MSTANACPRCCAICGAAISTSSGSTSSRVAEPQRRHPHGGPAEDGRARGSDSAECRGCRAPLPEYRRRLRHSLFRRRTSRSTCRRSVRISITFSRHAFGRALAPCPCRSNWADISSARRGCMSPGSSTERKAGAVFVVVDGGLHHQLAASGNFGTGHSAQLSAGDRQQADPTAGREGDRSSAVSARRWTCWATVSPCRRWRSATWWSSSSPAPMG